MKVDFKDIEKLFNNVIFNKKFVYKGLITEELIYTLYKIDSRLKICDISVNRGKTVWKYEDIKDDLTDIYKMTVKHKMTDIEIEKEIYEQLTKE